MRNLKLLASVLAAACLIPCSARAADDCQRKGADVAAAEKKRADAQKELKEATDKLDILVQRARAAEGAYDEVRRKLAVDQRAYYDAAVKSAACHVKHRRDARTACAALARAASEAFDRRQADRAQLDRFAVEIGESEMAADAARRAYWDRVKDVEKALEAKWAAQEAQGDCPVPSPDGKHHA
jgi:hypothetical protein